MATTPTPATDGRHLRRGRNRDAVVRALLSLYNEGNLDPSTDEIAARSSVSARSVFRYFDDVDDLCQAAISQQLADLGHLTTVAAAPEEPTAAKIDALVRQRGELFEAIESVGMVSRLRAPFQLAVADRLAENRGLLRAQIATLFAPELAAMGTDLARLRLAAADVASSFEAWRLLRDDQGLSRAAAAATLTDTLHLLLGGTR